MAQYNPLNVKLCNSKLNKLKSGIKKITLERSSNVADDSNDENNFPNTQISKPRKSFANNSSANMKLSKTLLPKIVQSGGFVGRLFGSLDKTG